MRGIAGEPHPAALGVAPIGLAKARRGAHDTVFEDAAGAVGRLVQRIELRPRKTRRLLQHRSASSAISPPRPATASSVRRISAGGAAEGLGGPPAKSPQPS